MSTLLLFSQYYPFLPGEEFLETEVEFLAEAFERVFVIPAREGHDRRELPANAELVLDFARRNDSRGRRLLRLPGVARHLVGNLGPLWSELRAPVTGTPKHAFWKATAATWAKTGVYQAVLQRVVNRLSQHLSGPSIAYTYWFTPTTYALSRVLGQRNLPVVSRCHGFDCFPERNSVGFFPMRRSMSRGVARIFPCSDVGRSALFQQVFQEKQKDVLTARLGVRDPGVVNHASENEGTQLVSCSYAVPIKRLDLIAEGVREFAMRYPKRRVRWTHLGGGPDVSMLVDVGSTVPENLEVIPVGALSNADVICFYQNQPVDAFLNCSRSEGVSVAIMEAMSFGIPVVATAVGGTPEIVNQSNGELLPANPKAVEIADAIDRVVGAGATRRLEARRMWAAKYDGPKNYREFACHLKRLAGRADQKDVFTCDSDEPIVSPVK